MFIFSLNRNFNVCYLFRLMHLLIKIDYYYHRLLILWYHFPNNYSMFSCKLAHQSVEFKLFEMTNAFHGHRARSNLANSHMLLSIVRSHWRHWLLSKTMELSHISNASYILLDSNKKTIVWMEEASFHN